MVAEFVSKCGNYKIVIDYDDEFVETPEASDCYYEGFSFVLPSRQRNFCPKNTYDLDDFEDYDYENDKEISIFETLEKEFGKENVFNLYAYIHGYIRLSLASNICTCRWDSGQIGFLVFEPDKNKCLDNDLKHNPQVVEKLAISYINDYNKYVNSEVLKYIIYEREPLFNKEGEEVSEEWNSIGCCCGYYDEEDCLESAFEEAIYNKPDIEFDCDEFKKYREKYKKSQLPSAKASGF